MPQKNETIWTRRDVDDVVVGCVTAYGEQAMCIARMSVLAAEWPNDSTGVTINRFCGSGQQAVNFAAMGIKSGEQDLVGCRWVWSPCPACR